MPQLVCATYLPRIPALPWNSATKKLGKRSQKKNSETEGKRALLRVGSEAPAREARNFCIPTPLEKTPTPLEKTPTALEKTPTALEKTPTAWEKTSTVWGTP